MVSLQIGLSIVVSTYEVHTECIETCSTVRSNGAGTTLAAAMMDSATDRSLRSVYPLSATRRWCTAYARRWCIPNDELACVVIGPDIIPFPPDVQARADRVRDIAELLDSFILSELQWNFWYRPSICNPTSPMCRLGWSGTCLEELQGELRVLREKHSRAAPTNVDPLSVLKLFKPATMFKRLERGYAVTHVFIERKPVRHEPLEFAPDDYAPFASGPSLGALIASV